MWSSRLQDLAFVEIDLVDLSLDLGICILGFSHGSGGKESTCNVGNLGSIPGLGRSPGGGYGNPLPYSCQENPIDRGALWATYSPWGHKELDTTEVTKHIYILPF